MMEETGRIICCASELREGGRGRRFFVRWKNEERPAFVIRYRGRLHAFLNRCPHAGHELDWDEGAFFDQEGQALVCASHGARYDPEGGTCLSGACNGVGLTPLEVAERAGQVVINAKVNEGEGGLK